MTTLTKFETKNTTFRILYSPNFSKKESLIKSIELALFILNESKALGYTLTVKDLGTKKLKDLKDIRSKLLISLMGKVNLIYIKE